MNDFLKVLLNIKSFNFSHFWGSEKLKATINLKFSVCGVINKFEL